MELPVRPLTESRIRELLDGMQAFNERISKKGRTKAGRTPLPLPAAKDYPSVGSLADAIAPSYSDDPDEVAFFRDVMRLQELFAFTQGRIPARAAIDAAIATLRRQEVVIVSHDPDADIAELYTAEMRELHSAMFSSRIAQLETVTDEELSAVERFAPEIGPALMRGMTASPASRRARSR